MTCAKILAAVYGELGKSVQTFGDYSGERSGAPVRAYLRVSDELITIRNKVYDPHHIAVLDATLLDEAALSGLAPGGTLLLNTPESADALGTRFPQFTAAAVDATAIARRHKIGTRTVVIVNTTIAGAFVRVLGLPIDLLEHVYRDLGFLSNLAAAREAYEAVRVHAARTELKTAVAATPLPKPTPVADLVEHKVSTPTALKTGSWRTQIPSYRAHLAPCNAWCPAGNDVVGFVQALARRGEEAAAEVLARSTPFPGVCGRVCPAPCMEGCNRREYDGAVNIRALERWISDRAAPPKPAPERSSVARRFAVVGGGPAGLTAAQFLTRAGQRVVLFEGERELGGVLRTGIPSYRLPRQVVDREIGAILALGVEARVGQALDAKALTGLAKEFDALILATGLQRLRRLDGPGADLTGVEQGIRFLHRLNFGGEAKLSGHVVVLGGGNTAMDCARSAKRAGASRVTVAYRRSRAEMPAIREEIDEAEHEGVELLLLKAPVGFKGTGRVASVILADVELGPADASGRRSPVVTDRRSDLACDSVLLALGQSADLSILPEGWQLEKGRIHHDGGSLPVFASGDVSTGDGTVTHAIGDGRRAATRALVALGLASEEWERPDRARAVPITDIRLGHFARAESTHEKNAPVPDRVRNFDEVNRGLENGLEAHRCFSCGDCTQCDTCLVYCPEGIIQRKGAGYDIDYSCCKGCGICVAECPRKGMEMTA